MFPCSRARALNLSLSEITLKNGVAAGVGAFHMCGCGTAAGDAGTQCVTSRPDTSASGRAFSRGIRYMHERYKMIIKRMS